MECIPQGVFPVRMKYNKTREKWDKAPAIPKGVSWKTYQATQEELADSPNYGVMIPSGVLLFDLDIGESAGILTLQSNIDTALGVAVDWDDAYVQTTVSGGAHYAFEVPETVEFNQLTQCLGVSGFDLRVAGKGWICTGDKYQMNDSPYDDVIEALHSDWMPVLPEKAIAALQKGSVKEVGSDDNGLLTLVVNRPLDLSDDDIEYYMGLLPPCYADNQDDWYRVGMALHHQTGGSEFGWILFDTFSRKTSMDNYDVRQNKTRWESFGGGDRVSPITFASIIRWVNDDTDNDAAADGRVVRTPPAGEPKEQTVNNALEELDTLSGVDALKTFCSTVANLRLDKFDITRIASKIKDNSVNMIGQKLTIPDIKALLKTTSTIKAASGKYLDDYVFVTQQTAYMSVINKQAIGKEAFNVKHSRHTPLDREGCPQLAAGYALNRIRCVDDYMYVPSFGLFFTHDRTDYVNTYAEVDLVAVEGDGAAVQRIKDHVAHLLPDADEQAVFINYLAHSVQFPGKKIEWSIILQGVQGDGKSFFAVLMQIVMGFRNIRILNAEDLESAHTGWAEGQCMTFIEELKLGNHKYYVLNKLKPYMSNTSVSCKPIYGSQRTIINTTNYIALTNFKDAIPIDDNERRYYVLFSQWQDKVSLKAFEVENPDYYPSLYDTARNNGGELRHWLLHHPIPQSFLNTKRAPETRAMATMAELSRSDGYLAVEDAISEFSSDSINDHVVNMTELSRKATDAFSTDNKDFPKTSALKNILMDMGYHPIGIHKANTGVKGKRKNQILYCKDPEKEAIDFKDILNITDKEDNI